MSDNESQPKLDVDKIFRDFIYILISIAGPIYIGVLVFFDLEDLLVGSGSWISSFIIMFLFNISGYIFHNVTDETIEESEIIKKIVNNIPILEEHRQKKLFPILFSFLGVLFAIMNFYVITQFGDATVEVSGKLLYSDGLPVIQETLYLNYDNDCTDDPRFTIKQKDLGKFKFQDIPYEKQFFIYIRGDDWEDSENCESIILLLDRERFPIWKRYFRLEIPLNSIVYYEGIETLPTPTLDKIHLTPTQSPTVILETVEPSITPTPTISLVPTTTPLNDIYDDFNDNEISLIDWSPINKYTLPSILVEDWQTLLESNGKLILPEAEAILGGLFSTKPHCVIEEIQVVFSNYKYDIVDARYENPKSWVGITVPITVSSGDTRREIGVWISSGNIGTRTNTRVIWTENSVGSISGPYKDNIIVNNLVDSNIVLGVKFDGEFAMFSVGNIESDEMVPIQAIGYPNYFAISYKVQEGAMMTFSIDEVRIKYRNNSICSP